MIGRAKVGLIVKWDDVIGEVESVKWECKHIEIGIRGDTGLDHLVTPDTGHPPALGEPTVSMQMDPNFNCKATSAGNIWGKSIMSSWNVCLCEAWCCWGGGWGKGLELALQLSGFLCNEHIFNMTRISQYWDHKMKMTSEYFWEKFSHNKGASANSCSSGWVLPRTICSSAIHQYLRKPAQIVATRLTHPTHSTMSEFMRIFVNIEQNIDGYFSVG